MLFLSVAQRLLRKGCRASISAAAVLALSTLTTPVMAQSAQSAVFVVQNDRGGLVGPRADQIQRLKNNRQRVEIRGRICLSSCTMYLGAGNVCIDPNTRFGFHGPSFYGQPLQPEYFEYWSQVIASHYPAPVRAWFMNTGRFKINGYYTILGTELIRHGAQPC